MDSKDKLAILEHEYDLHGVFLSFCDYCKYSLYDDKTLNLFCDFLLDIIDDGSVAMVDVSQFVDGKYPPYAGTPEQFVAELQRIYPTMAHCQKMLPEEPKLYFEMLWWHAEPRQIDINPHFNLAIYQK